MNRKPNILIELTGRYLTDAEADQVRELVAAMKPRVHLIAANWRWLEVRGLSEEQTARLVASLQPLGLRFTIQGGGSNRRAKGTALKRKPGDFGRLAARA
jgi:hypothetical protein